MGKWSVVSWGRGDRILLDGDCHFGLTGTAAAVIGDGAYYVVSGGEATGIERYCFSRFRRPWPALLVQA